MITITQNKGFQLTFENGWTISVQIGTGNYCDRCDYSAAYNQEMSEPIIHCPNAEIAVWDENNKWFDFGNDTLKGWVPTEEVGEWIERVRNF